MKKIVACLFLIVFVFSFVACTGDDTALQERDALQEELRALQAAYETLGDEHAALQEEYEALRDEYEDLAVEFEELQAEYAQRALVEAAALTEEIPTEGEAAATADSLVGTWMWMGSPYYVLEENGPGTMSGTEIRWTTRGGVFSVCITPASCGSTCIAPAEWNYTLSGNRLNLTSTTIPGMSFEYTRR